MGGIKEIHNLNRKFGANVSYLFCKVEEQHGDEEYWLITHHELEDFMERANDNPDDIAYGLDSGEFIYLENGRIHALLSLDEEPLDLLILSSELEEIRYRVEQNIEDIEEHKDNWFFDLFD